MRLYFPFLFVALGLFGVECLIALYGQPLAFLRGSVGDFLVVILLFFAVKSILNVSNSVLAWCVLGFALCVEFAQWLQVADTLALTGAMRIVVGTHFSVLDMLMYAMGTVSAYVLVTWFESRVSAEKGGAE